MGSMNTDHPSSSGVTQGDDNDDACGRLPDGNISQSRAKNVCTDSVLSVSVPQHPPPQPHRAAAATMMLPSRGGSCRKSPPPSCTQHQPLLQPPTDSQKKPPTNQDSDGTLMKVSTKQPGLTQNSQETTPKSPVKRPPPACNSLDSTPPTRQKRKTEKSASSLSAKHVSSATSRTTSGRWTAAEHAAFLRGMGTYGREWKKVARHIPTRTSAQVRSHAQKYLHKVQKMQQQQDDLPPPDYDSSSLDMRRMPPDYMLPSSASASLLEQSQRIWRNPETVASEVTETVALLRQRYQWLQQRLAERTAAEGAATATQALQKKSKTNEQQKEEEDDEETETKQEQDGGSEQPEEPPEETSATLSRSSSTSSRLESCGEDELIAVSVLLNASIQPQEDEEKKNSTPTLPSDKDVERKKDPDDDEKTRDAS